MPPATPFVAPTVSYAPTAVVAAKPIAPTKRKAVGASAQDRANTAARTKEKEEAVGKELETWYEGCVALSGRLSEMYGKKPEYYLRLMFSGGYSMQKARGPNAYNAWTHQLAMEHNQEDADSGDATNLVDLAREHADEYAALTATEKRQLVKSFEDERDSRAMGVRVNPRGCKQDANAVFEKIEKMITGLKCRVGIDGFYCFFKNNSEYQMRPRWFFTTPQLDRYLGQTIKRWDVEMIGGLGEAFSIAGCDIMSFLRTSRARCDWLKSEIRDKITIMLVKITGQKNIVMQYKTYDKDIVIERGVELVGWTHEVFTCPSSLPNALEPLQKLLQAIDDGQCHFKRLSHSEVAAGEVAGRKERVDKGKRRGKYRPRKKPAAQQNEDEEHGDGGEGSRPRKRLRKNPQPEPEAQSSSESE
ncbi:hypothetical protein OH76DRAFT_1489212 [Lentinus brumalis]|uniref:Uncharacterized protein n=1 Tax=Lentinus brumalis TaxID=2498619 RepID=A0A371CNA5_9APHY|nr:hypothetical protein OH76DRAFT_1489212 [Polyporus brumalis]